MKPRRPLTFTPRFSAVEVDRLVALLKEWLQLEADRPPFAVAALEERLELEVGGLPLQVVVDRLDRLADGRLLVIDYKTGRHSLSEWLQERPVEPQGPLYGLFLPQPVAGFSFGVVRKGECRYLGIGQEEDLIPGMAGYASHPNSQHLGSWEALLDTWRRSLEALAEELKSGLAAVTPISWQASCRSCDLQPLCRIQEQGRTGFEGEPV
jgi:hypothetical protein